MAYRSSRRPRAGAGLWLALLLVLAFACTAAAQQGGGGTRVLTGTVVREGVGVPGVPVTLHRVTSDTSGALATQQSGPGGEFRFVLPPSRGAGFTVFFTTADYASVRYFGAPVHPDQPTSDYRLAVYDTSSAPAVARTIRMVRRDLVMIPGEEGNWEINEVVRVNNPGTTTLVSRSGMPTWSFRIPEEATDFEAGEGEIVPGEVSRMGDRVLLLGSLTPGQRELFIRYLIPGGKLSSITVESPSDTLNVFVQQPSPAMTVQGATSTKVVEAQGQRFLQYGVEKPAAGTLVRIGWEGGSGLPVSPITAAIGVTVLLLGVGAFAAVRRPRRPAPLSQRARQVPEPAQLEPR